MSNVALLNPERESKVCRDFIDQAVLRLQDAEQKLVAQLLKHEEYLIAFGQAQALRALVEELELSYRRNFEV